MKVLHIISGGDSGGAKTHLLNLCGKDNKYFENIIGCINDGVLYSDAKRLGIETVLFMQWSRMDMSIIKTIVQFINQNCVDIVNFHGANPNFLHAFLKNRVDVPTATTVHSDYRYDFINNRLKQALFTPINGWALRRFDNFICVSKRIEEVLQRAGYGGHKFVVGNGVDTARKIWQSAVEIRSEFSIPHDAFVYTMVARFHPIKNHSTLILAFKRLYHEYKDTRLMLVGGGDYKDSIMHLANKLGVGKGVIFAGHRDNAVDFINASEVNILTSFNETFPIVILEGGLVKKAAICSDVGDIKDILDDSTGFIVNPNSESDIYEKMKDAYLKRDSLKEMGERLHRYVLQNYTIDKFCSRYYAAYKKILSGDKK